MQDKPQIAEIIKRQEESWHGKDTLSATTKKPSQFFQAIHALILQTEELMKKDKPQTKLAIRLKEERIAQIKLLAAALINTNCGKYPDDSLLYMQCVIIINSCTSSWLPWHGVYTNFVARLKAIINSINPSKINIQIFENFQYIRQRLDYLDEAETLLSVKQLKLEYQQGFENPQLEKIDQELAKVSGDEILAALIDNFHKRASKQHKTIQDHYDKELKKIEENHKIMVGVNETLKKELAAAQKDKEAFQRLILELQCKEPTIYRDLVDNFNNPNNSLSRPPSVRESPSLFFGRGGSVVGLVPVDSPPKSEASSDQSYGDLPTDQDLSENESSAGYTSGG